MAAVSQRSVILLLALAGFASMASMRITDAMLPALSQDFGRPIADVAQNITVFAIAYGLMQLVYGPWGDRHGALRVISLASLACAIGTLGTALADSLTTLLVFRTLNGATAAAIVPLSMAWVGDNVPYEERQVTLIHMLSGTILGLTTGQLSGGLLADTLGWQSAFFLLTVLFLVSGTLLLTALRRQPALASARGGHQQTSFAARLGGILALTKARHILALVFLEGLAVFGALAFVASHLHARLGISLTLAGMTVAFFGVGGLCFAALARHVVGRLGERRLAGSGGLLMGLGFIGLAWAPLIGLAMAAAFCTGLGFYMMHSTLQTNATQIAPTARGTAMTIFAGCLFLGQSVGVSLGGVILRLAGATWLLTGAGLWLLALGLLFALRLRQWQRQADTKTA